MFEERQPTEERVIRVEVAIQIHPVDITESETRANARAADGQMEFIKAHTELVKAQTDFIKVQTEIAKTQAEIAERESPAAKQIAELRVEMAKSETRTRRWAIARDVATTAISIMLKFLS